MTATPQPTNLVRILESGVIFGDFLSETVFQIEKSVHYQQLGDGFKVVEFIYSPLQKNEIQLIEAKSTIPNPKSSPEKYEEFWQDIVEKFENALSYQCLANLGRPMQRQQELSTKFTQLIWSHLTIRCVLVIPQMPQKFLPSTTEMFRKKLSKLKKMWCIQDLDIIVANQEQAKKLNLIQ